MVESNKTYIGIVEDNNDPDKLGRIKARVINVFDDIPLDGIPWANPWKDLNGNAFNVPEIGKIVIVVFDNDNEDNPEYVYSDHYNINLENKLKSLSNEDYTSMKSLIFDHKTQIYVNDSEGLKIDYKYNNLNIKENEIDINLKDNNATLNIGDSTANQQVILGNHFMDWVDRFLKQLVSGGLFNGGGPAVPNPSLLKLILEFQSLKDIKFLSNHINVVDNNKISTVRTEKREDEAQYGDKWSSTKEDNEFTKYKAEFFTPKDGPKEEYNSDDTQQSNDDNSIGVDNTLVEDLVLDADTNVKVQNIISYLENKEYRVYKQTNILNLVAMRDKENGEITNKFDEILYVFYLNENNKWELREYNITTVPGYKRDTYELPENVNLLALGQYIDQCELSYYKNDSNHRSLVFNECVVHVNDKIDEYNYVDNLKRGNFGISIHKSTYSGTADFVFDYSENGDQVFKNSNQYSQFIKLCEKHSLIKSKFTYTLCKKSEFEKYLLNLI